jgi:hypothetical protein
MCLRHVRRCKAAVRSALLIAKLVTLSRETYLIALQYDKGFFSRIEWCQERNGVRRLLLIPLKKPRFGRRPYTRHVELRRRSGDGPKG